MSGESAERAEARIAALEAENKALRSKLETAEDALAGAHRVIRQARDKDSTIAPLDN
jgi:multidrug resistance efflux pump